MLTALFEERARPAGGPGNAVVRKDVMRGRSTEAWGYENVGPVAVRIDALETILATRARPRQLQHLGIDAATGSWVVKQLASLSASGFSAS